LIADLWNPYCSIILCQVAGSTQCLWAQCRTTYYVTEILVWVQNELARILQFNVVIFLDNTNKSCNYKWIKWSKHVSVWARKSEWSQILLVNAWNYSFIVSFYQILNILKLFWDFDLEGVCCLAAYRRKYILKIYEKEFSCIHILLDSISYNDGVFDWVCYTRRLDIKLQVSTVFSFWINGIQIWNCKRWILKSYFRRHCQFDNTASQYRITYLHC